MPLDAAARRHSGTRGLIGRPSACGPLPPRALPTHTTASLSRRHDGHPGEESGSVAGSLTWQASLRFRRIT